MFFFAETSCSWQPPFTPLPAPKATDYPAHCSVRLTPAHSLPNKRSSCTTHGRAALVSVRMQAGTTAGAPRAHTATHTPPAARPVCLHATLWVCLPLPFRCSAPSSGHKVSHHHHHY